MEEQSAFERMSTAVINAHKAMKILQTENEQLKQQNDLLKSELTHTKVRLNEALALNAKQLKTHSQPQASSSSKRQKLNTSDAALLETRRAAAQSFGSSSRLNVPIPQHLTATRKLDSEQLPYEMITEPFEVPEDTSSSGVIIQPAPSSAMAPKTTTASTSTSKTAPTPHTQTLRNIDGKASKQKSDIPLKSAVQSMPSVTINYDVQKGREVLPPSASKGKSGPERALSLLKYLDHDSVFSVAIALTKLTPQSVTKTLLQTLGRYARLNLKHIWSYGIAKRGYIVYQQEIELFVKLLQALFDSECKNGLETFNTIITGLYSALISRLKFRCGNAIEHLHCGQPQSLHANMQSMIAAMLIELRIATSNQLVQKKGDGDYDVNTDVDGSSSIGEAMDSDDEAEDGEANEMADETAAEDSAETIQTEQLEESKPDCQEQPSAVDQSRQEELRKLFNMDTLDLDESDSDHEDTPSQLPQTKINMLDITEEEIQAAIQTVYDRLEVITAEEVLCLEHSHDFLLLYLALRMMIELDLKDMLSMLIRDLEVVLLENIHAVAGAVYALMIIHNQYPHLTTITELLIKWTAQAQTFIAVSEGEDKSHWAEMEGQVYLFCAEQMQSTVSHIDFQHISFAARTSPTHELDQHSGIWSVIKRVITTDLSPVTCALFGLDEYTVHICHLMHGSLTSSESDEVMSMEEMLKLPLSSSDMNDSSNDHFEMAMIQSRQQWWRDNIHTLQPFNIESLNHYIGIFFERVVSPMLACYDMRNTGWRLHDKTVTGVPLQAIFTTRTQVIHDLYENYRRQSTNGLALLTPPFPRTEKGDVRDLLSYAEFVSADGDSLVNATRALDFIQAFIYKTQQGNDESNVSSVVLDKIKQQAHELRLLFAFLMLERMLQMWLISVRGFLHYCISLSSETDDSQQQQLKGLLKSVWQFMQMIPKPMSYTCRGELAYELKQCLTTLSGPWSREALLQVTANINHSLPCFVIHPTISEPHCLEYHRRFLIRASKAGLLSIAVDLVKLQAHEVSRSDVTTAWNSTLHSKMDRKVVARKDMVTESVDVVRAAYHIHIWRKIAAVYAVKQRNAAIKSLFYHSNTSSASQNSASEISSVVEELYLQSNFTWSADDSPDDHDFYLIFQPDGMPKNSDLTLFRAEILKLVRNLPTGWDICFFGGVTPSKGSGSLFREVSYQPRHAYYKINYSLDNAGYIIKGNTAKKLLEQLPVTGPIDAFMSSLLFHDELQGYLIQLCTSERQNNEVYGKVRSKRK